MESKDFKYKHIIVDKLLKKTNTEKTEKIFLVEDDGSHVGPFLRKVFRRGYGLGSIYFHLKRENDKVNACPFIPDVFSVYSEEGYLTVIEEYINGQALNDYIKDKKYSDKLVEDLFKQICRSVVFLHQGFSDPIIHRDIKPENILVTKDGVVKLIDFGISRTFDDEKDTDTHKYGTVGYASPEQFGYQQTDERSDIYSLGKVLEFMINQDNWKKKSDAASPYFDSVIKKACSIDPKYRYQNIDELLKDFEKVADGGSFFQKLARNKTVLMVGHVWNVLLTLATLFLITASIYSVVEPGYFPNANIAQRIAYGIILIFFVFLPIYAIFTYKPSIRRVIKRTPKHQFWQYLIFILCCFTLLILMLLLTQLIA